MIVVCYVCRDLNTAEFNEYAEKVREKLHNAGYWSDCDTSKVRMNKKIRNAQVLQYNFILVVGAKEQETQSVNVRTRDVEVHGVKTIDELLQWFKQLEDNYE